MGQDPSDGSCHVYGVSSMRQMHPLLFGFLVVGPVLPILQMEGWPG